MAVEGSVPQSGVIVPHLVVRDTAEALSFYERAFGATVLYRSPSPSGEGEHLHLKLWDSLVQVSSEEPAHQQRTSRGRYWRLLNRLAGLPACFRFQCPMWMRRTRKPWMKEAVQLYLLQPCSGVIVMAGFAIRSAMYGR